MGVFKQGAIVYLITFDKVCCVRLLCEGYAHNLNDSRGPHPSGHHYRFSPLLDLVLHPRRDASGLLEAYQIISPKISKLLRKP